MILYPFNGLLTKEMNGAELSCTVASYMKESSALRGQATKQTVL